MNDVRGCLADAARRLGGVSDTARLDAELLMAYALGVSREAMLLSRLGDEVPAEFDALLARRMASEPVAYITGTRDFWTISLNVSPAVLIPRPDSETLIEAAVGHFGNAGPKRVLDLGTGSGALLLAALSEWTGASGAGVDASEAALAVAVANAKSLGLTDRAAFALGDWGEGLDERFDLILCNPPYVESGTILAAEVADYEPASALFAGGDGLEDYRRLMPQFARLMEPGAIVALEIGAEQAEVVSALALETGLAARCFQDLAGRNRCLLLTQSDHQIR
ncbi:MAG: peptide chain release factor N(5)-glutamine methyltransferase [Pseudomonadota bacterium]